MSHLSYLEKLLDGVDVEWKALGGLAENLDAMRKPITSGLRVSGTIPYYGASGIVDYVKDYIFDGDFLLVSEDGANLLARNTPIAFSISGKSWVNNHAHVLKFNTYVERRFVDIYLNSIDLTPYISGAAQPKLNQKNLNSIPIPIPCPDNPEKSLAIQAEIVRILDAFTAMTAELTAELNLRKKQYNYYRDQLLSFEESDVEWKTLGEICESITSGKNKDKSETGKFPVYGSTGVIGRTKIKAYEIEQILVARVGANAGRVNIASGEYDVSDNTLILKLKTKYNLKFLYYYLVNLNLNRFVKGAGQPLLTAGQLKAMVIPVPTPEEQSRIVSILDNFDGITNSITEGLPREIELRQKQYEYYRDLLLSFPKSDEAA